MPGVTFGGAFTGDVDTRAATRHVRITGTGVTLTIAGQSIGGDITFEQSDAGVAFTLRNGTLQLGSVVDVQHADGSLALTSAGLVADLTITQFTFSLGGASLALDPGGSVSLHVDTAASALSVRVLKGVLTVGANHLRGDFAFDQDATTTRFEGIALTRRNRDTAAF